MVHLLKIVFILNSLSFLGAEDLVLTDIIRDIETQHLAKTSYAKTRMQIKKKSWSRDMVLSMYGEGRDKFLARIEAPIKDRGLTSLKINQEMWNYMPNIDRTIKVPSSLMGDSWMGSHFTNDDLIKSNRIEELYSLKKTQSQTDLFVIEAIPKEDSAVVWGKILYHIKLPQKVAVKVEYFDEDHILVRKMSLENFREIEGRHIPMLMRISPIENPEESTTVIYEDLKLNLPLDTHMFSVQALRRRKN